MVHVVKYKISLCHKCTIFFRPYVVNMLPCISRICKRPEEAIQDTLDTAMQKLCPVLMGFTTDVEVKVDGLLQPVIRSISMFMLICQMIILIKLCFAATLSWMIACFWSFFWPIKNILSWRCAEKCIFNRSGVNIWYSHSKFMLF